MDDEDRVVMVINVVFSNMYIGKLCSNTGGAQCIIPYLIFLLWWHCQRRRFKIGSF